VNDLVIVSLERWDAVWRRNQYLVDGLLLLDPSLRVLFVEPPADPFHDLLARRRVSWGHGPRRHGDSERLWIFRPTKALPRRIDPGADDRIAGAIAGATRRLGMSDPIVWVNDPGAARLLQRDEASAARALYDITDDWLAAARAPAERTRLAHGERFLLTTAAEVVACSRELVQRKSPQRPEGRHPIVLIPNAVDTAAYREMRPRPDDMPAGTVAVYAGTIHSDRFDVATTLATARALRGSATVVLVGPNLLEPTATAELRDAGVVLLGVRPRADLVGYLQHADVLLVPHIVDDFTDSLDPIKLYEYTAAGRRVVSTPVAGFRDSVDDLVVCATAERFPAAVLHALTTPYGNADRRAVPDWADRARAMHQVLERLRSR
jgi:teichuronic acid biosynthesis glycosyltransferase TuaH